jgi:hypothetical protein
MLTLRHKFFHVQYKVEILFMFCSICEGREVVRMQDELAKLGLVPVLKDLFDSLDWDAPIPTGPQETHGLHGPGCECNPEMVSWNMNCS